MLKYFLVLWQIHVFVQINSANIEIDLLKALELEDFQVSTEGDGKFYHFTDAVTKDMTINFDELSNSYALRLDFVLRFPSFDLREYAGFNVLKIQNSNNNTFCVGIVLDAGKQHNMMRYDSTPLALDNCTIRDYIMIENEQAIDGKWHHISFALENKDSKTWVDCKTNYYSAFMSKKNALQFFTGNIQQHYVIWGAAAFSKNLKGIDIKELKLINIEENTEPSCTIIEELNSKIDTTTKHLDVTRHFYIQNQEIDYDNDLFYRFTSELTTDLRISDPFANQTGQKNFTFECIFRHEGVIEGQMILLKFEDGKEGDTTTFAITSGNYINWIDYMKFRDKFYHARGILNETNIYDGNWHQIVIQFSYTSDRSWLSQLSYYRLVKFWVDCKLVGQDYMYADLQPKTFLQRSTIMKNNLKQNFSNFDIKKMAMYVDNENEICSTTTK